MSVNKTVQTLKEEGQDYEWYPTTEKILRWVARDIQEKKNEYNRGCHLSMLDIGAGNGQTFDMILNVLNEFSKDEYDKSSIKKFGMEISKVLINQMPDDVFIIGSDFERQTLIDKKVDVIFCNPPYSKYAQWTEKIILEANAEYIYLVIPNRWESDPRIIKAIARRGLKEGSVEVLGSFDFRDSEFRKARAEVQVIRIELKKESYRREGPDTDPFDLWFEDNFKINADKSKHNDYGSTTDKREQIKSLLAGQNLIERLEELYLQDLDKLLNTYKSLESLDHDLLRELDVNLEGCKEGLKLKIEGLKNVYWRELFDHLDSLTDRLTSSSRKNMLETLNKNTQVDFSANNAYAVVIWAIKNANKYYDTQLVEVYKDITTPDAVRNYKSNKNIIEDGWRFCKKSVTHYTLDYRIVLPHYRCFNDCKFGIGSYDFPQGLCQSAHDKINDLCTIAYNLGFEPTESSFSFEWAPGKQKEIYCTHKGKSKLLGQFRAYKNGNLHFKLNQEFMTAFNIEASRLNGWVKDQTDLEKETDIKQSDIQKYYMKNIKLGSIKLLPGPALTNA